MRGKLSKVVVAPAIWAMGLMVGACDGGGRSTAPSHDAPLAEDPGLVDEAALAISQDVCEDPDAQLRPFVITWDASDRSELEAHTSQRIAVVKLEGCEIELLPGCQLDGGYSFRETSLNTQRLMLASETEVQRTLPFAQVALSEQASRSDRLALEYGVRGIQHASRPAVFSSELGSGCEGATHFVLNYAAGAFRLDRHAARANVDQRASTALDAESVLFKGGDVSKCPDATNCSGPVRVRLVPISMGEPADETDRLAADLARDVLDAGSKDGKVTKDVIKAVVRYARPALVGCVRSHTVEGQQPVGKVTYDFTISPEGTVAGAAPTVVGTLEPEFVECVTDVVYSLRFPRSRNVTRVTYPLKFNTTD